MTLRRSFLAVLPGVGLVAFLSCTLQAKLEGDWMLRGNFALTFGERLIAGKASGTVWGEYEVLSDDEIRFTSENPPRMDVVVIVQFPDEQTMVWYLRSMDGIPKEFYRFSRITH